MPAGANPILSRTVPPPGVATSPEPPRAPAWRGGDLQVRTTIVILVLVIASLILLLIALLAGSRDAGATTSRPVPTHAGGTTRSAPARPARLPAAAAPHRPPEARTVARRPGQANAKVSASTA